MTIKIAITGNIASGKSLVEKTIKERFGYPVYDSDNFAHEVLDTITDFYGYDVFLKGKIDRKKLGDLVFSNPELLKKLDDITHPLIKQKIIEKFNMHCNEKFVFVSVPLLFEANFDYMFDKILIITINPELQLERLMKRNNLSKEDALKRIKSQLDLSEKIKKSDYIISNNSTEQDLIENTCKFIQEINSL